MVDKKVVVKTIKKMLDSGIEDDVIQSTLSDLGLTESEAEELLASAKGKSVSSEEKTAETDDSVEEGIEEAIESDESDADESSGQNYDIDSVIKKTSDRIKSHLAEKEQSDELKEQSTHLKLDEHDEKLDEIHSKIDLMHEKLDSSSAFFELNKKVSSIEKSISEIKSDLKDSKAQINAVHDIMKKILETERKLLTKK